MKNAIIILDVCFEKLGNKKMCDNAKENINEVSKKWNCDYFILNENLYQHLHPSFSKYKYALWYLEKYDKVLIVDNDILINLYSPNIFELYDNDKINVCLDHNFRFPPSHPQNIHIQNNIHRKYINFVIKYLNLKSFDTNRYLNNFFNGGFGLYNKKNTAVLQKFSDIISTYNKTLICAHPEQALINGIVSQLYYDQLNIIPIGWNYISPVVKTNIMNAYVYHFTGDCDRTLIKTYGGWKVHYQL